MSEKTFTVLWHRGFSGFNRTEIEAVEKPSNAEAAQIVGVIEDTDPSSIRIDSIKVKD